MTTQSSFVYLELWHRLWETQYWKRFQDWASTIFVTRRSALKKSKGTSLPN